MFMTNFRAAETLAADLAGASVDPNEAQKALAYLRSKRESKALFDYLRAVSNNGGAVIRSGRTLGYYRDLLAICQRHLRPLQDDYAQMLATFAWSLRLLRYYRAVSWAAEEKAAGKSRKGIAVEAQVSVPPARPAGPTIPAVGDIFTGPILDADESAVIIEAPGFAVEDVIGVIKAEHMGARKYRIGNAARVEVVNVRTLKNGRVIVEVKSAPKKG
ncbi:MAG: hypothetical protein MI924_19510 [Chloroflexales bacterium]|nr:hypothetical protein [Chloroflexales bacterium]